MNSPADTTTAADIHTIPQEWVDELRSLLDLLDGGPADNDQRARFILASNFLRDNGAAIAARICDATGATPSPTPAQTHFAEAERLLVGATEASTDDALPPAQRAVKESALLMRAQVHATLAQAASNEAILGFVATEVAAAAANRIMGYLR